MAVQRLDSSSVCVCERITSTELTVEMSWYRSQNIVFPFVTIKAQWRFNALVPPFSLQKRLVARRDVVETQKWAIGASIVVKRAIGRLSGRE